MSKKTKGKQEESEKDIQIEETEEPKVDLESQIDQDGSSDPSADIADDADGIADTDGDDNEGDSTDGEDEGADGEETAEEPVPDDAPEWPEGRKAGITSPIRNWARNNLGGIGDASLLQLDRMLDVIDGIAEESKEVVSATVEAVAETVTETVASIKAEEGEIPTEEADGDADSAESPAKPSDEATDGRQGFADAIFGAFPPYFTKKRYGRVDADIPQDEDESQPDGDQENALGGEPDADDAEGLGPWPIMPMSNILTERAAQRILDRSVDSDDDPISKSIRARKMIHESLDGIAPDFVTEGLSRASSKAIYKASKLSEVLTDMQDVHREGRTSEDITNLGMRFLKRLTGMLGEVSDITSDGLLHDSVESLDRAISWYTLGYHDTASLLGHEAAYDASLRVRREFDSAWEWLGENVFSDTPTSRGLPSHREFWDKDQELPHADDGIIDFGRIIRDMGNAVSGNPTSADLHALPYMELLRLSELLDEFAEVTQSWPEVYGNRPVLAEAGDDWEDRQYWNLLGGIRRGDRRNTMETVTETDGDGNEQVFYRVKTNRKMGLAFSAWTQDCHEASKVIEFWGRQNGQDPSTMTLLDIMTADEKATIMERRKAAWKWVGDHIFMMTC